MITDELKTKFPILSEVEAYCKRESVGSIARRHEVMRVAKLELDKIALAPDERDYVIGILKMMVFDKQETDLRVTKGRKKKQELFE